ncbi:hypothetical protein [Tenacibaculum finnmarkense]|uniref:hypothetical protein n=1 Tax=Tenacibaculum finnmarkense TaxID=2781243 RepID=UPI001E46E0AF|nr:hypothetical protein [Tenacibaculum finnmarkense]MCD8401379.1 hypothetical protein [Tenacibaculum finnmarkense genomovar ulcerans]
MNLELIYQGFENEIKKNIQTRMKNNNGHLDIIGVKEECLFFLLINTFMMKKRLLLKYEINETELPEKERKLLFVGFKKTLYKLIMNKEDVESVYDNIINSYNLFLKMPNIKDLINSHYNDLYNDYTSNLLN